MVIHGWASSSNFVEIGCDFAKNGIICHLFDMRGFGYSGGARRNSKIKDFLEDLHLIILQCRSDLPLFLYGHSLGGFVAMIYLILNKIKVSGVIFTAPFFSIPHSWRITVFKELLMNAVGSLMEVTIKLVLSNPQETMLNSSFNPTTLTKDNFTVTKINYFFKNEINLGFGLIKDFLDHHKIFKKNVHLFTNNCLLIQGEDDAIVDPKITTEIFQHLNSTDKTVKLIEGGFHELYADKEKKGISIMMVEWILDRTEDKG